MSASYGFLKINNSMLLNLCVLLAMEVRPLESACGTDCFCENEGVLCWKTQNSFSLKKLYFVSCEVDIQKKWEKPD